MSCWREIGLGLALAFAAPAVLSAQLATEGVFQRLAIGAANPAPDGPLTLGTLPTRASGQGVLSRDPAGVVRGGALAEGDIPASFTRRNVSESISSPWTFGGGIVGPLSVTSAVVTPAVQTSTGNLRLAPAGDVVLAPFLPGGAVVPSVSSGVPLGRAAARFLSLDVDELHAQTYVINETQAYTQGSLLVGRGSMLARPLTAGSAMLAAKHRAFRHHDVIVLRALAASGLPQYEMMRVLSYSPADCTGAVTPLPANCLGVQDGAYVYSVTRDVDGTGPDAWLQGDAVVSTGSPSDAQPAGIIDVYSHGSTLASFGAAVLADRPLLYFDFNDAGVAANRTAVSVHLTPTAYAGSCGYGGAPGWTALSGCGAWHSNAGSALVDMIEPLAVPALDSDALACSITVEMSVYPVTGADFAANPIAKWAHDTAATTVAVYHFGTAAGAGLSGQMAMWHTATTGGWRQAVPLTGVLSTGWHHVVMTYDPANGGRTYVNGTERGTPIPPSGGTGCAVRNTTPLRSTAWQGSYHISELAIYDRSLSPESVAAHYRARLAPRAGMSAGPTIAGLIRTGANSYDLSPRWVVGNLQGYYGYSRPTFGLAAGDQDRTWVSANAADGFVIKYGSATRFQADTGGNVTMTGDLSSSNWSLTNTAGLAFLQSSGPAHTARAISWAGGALIYGTGSSLSLSFLGGSVTMLSGGAQLLGSGAGYSTAAISATYGEGVRVSGGYPGWYPPLFPETDAVHDLGTPSKRWRTANFALSFNGSPAFVVVNRGGAGADSGSALGFFHGHTGSVSVRNSADTGACTLSYQIGLLMSSTC